MDEKELIKLTEIPDSNCTGLREEIFFRPNDTYVIQAEGRWYWDIIEAIQYILNLFTNNGTTMSGLFVSISQQLDTFRSHVACAMWRYLGLDTFCVIVQILYTDFAKPVWTSSRFEEFLWNMHHISEGLTEKAI